MSRKAKQTATATATTWIEGEEGFLEIYVENGVQKYRIHPYVDEADFVISSMGVDASADVNATVMAVGQ